MMFLLAVKIHVEDSHTEFLKPPHTFDWGLSIFHIDWHLIYSMYAIQVSVLTLQLGKTQ